MTEEEMKTKYCPDMFLLRAIMAGVNLQATVNFGEQDFIEPDNKCIGSECACFVTELVASSAYDPVQKFCRCGKINND